jgi:hypothetical protein
MSDGRGSENTGGRRVAEHNMIAVYPDAEAARAAVTQLERKGVEAGNIEVLGPGTAGADQPQTNEEQRRADLGQLTAVEKRSAAGMAVGAVIGAVAVALAAVALDALFDIPGPTVTVALLGAVGGALFGAFGGFFYGGASGLPVSDAWGETFSALEDGRTAVAVHSGDADQVERAIAALRDTGSLRLARFGRDGKVVPT